MLQHDDIRLFRQLGSTHAFTLDISPFANSSDRRRRDRAFTFGFLLFIILFLCNSFPANIHFSLIYAALSPTNGLDLKSSANLISCFDSEAVGTLDIWLRLVQASSSIDEVVSAIHEASDNGLALRLLLEEWGCERVRPICNISRM